MLVWIVLITVISTLIIGLSLKLKKMEKRYTKLDELFEEKRK